MKTPVFYVFIMVTISLAYFEARTFTLGSTADTLLSSTASLEDVLWGLYYFLDHHPTETLLVSLKVDHGSVSVPVQEEAHTLITGPGVSNYWVQNTTVGPSDLQQFIII